VTQRKYANAAERQRAYIARLKAQPADAAQVEKLNERLSRAKDVWDSVLHEVDDAKQGTQTALALRATLARIEAILRPGRA